MSKGGKRMPFKAFKTKGIKLPCLISKREAFFAALYSIKIKTVKPVAGVEEKEHYKNTVTRKKRSKTEATKMIRYTALLVLCLAFCHASLREYQQDHYHSYYKKEDISEIPQLGDANPLVNLQGEAAQRDYFLDNLVKAADYKTTVFKIQMERERVIISDPIGVRSAYLIKNIIKSTGGTSTEFNDLISGGYIPSFMDNGEILIDVYRITSNIRPLE